MTDTLHTVEAQDLSIEKLLQDFYVVPSFQRDYVWGSEEVEQLLTDIFNEYEAGQGEYFIGTIIVAPGASGTYELIDGQQRMTTIYLFLCALRDYLKERGWGSIAPLDVQIAASYVDDDGRNVFSERLKLQYEDTQEVLRSIARGQPVDGKPRQATRSIENLLTAYQTIRIFLRDKFGEDETGLRRYYAYLTKRVKVIRAKTLNLAQALRVFETINDRGVGLDAMDLLKNLLFMKADRDQFEQLRQTWKELSDTLHHCREKPMRFLRYFIVAEYGVEATEVREGDIYDWFTKNQAKTGVDADPIGFARTLLQAARDYVHFAGGRDVLGERNRYLTNLRQFAGTARQHLILLLAARHLSRELFTEFTRHLENLFFAYIITREHAREFERRFGRWAAAVRQIQSHADLESFLQQNFEPEKKRLSLRFTRALAELNEQDIQKYRLRYILAKLAQYVDERAWGNQGAVSDLSNYINPKVDIEHILPQTPSAEVLAGFDRQEEYEDFVRRLGNLTLLEKSIDSSVSNRTFSEKQPAYRQSKFLLTRALGERIQVGTNTAIDRIVRELDVFERWDSTAIERRQRMLVRLAHQVWDIPQVEEAEA